MGHNSQHAFIFAGACRSGPQGRAQAAFVLRKGAFDVPAAAVQPPGELSKHAPSVRAGGSKGAWAARIDRDDGRRDAEFLTADAVIRLRIIGRVTEQSVDRRELNRLRHGGDEIRPVVARAVAYSQGGDQVAGVVGDHRQLGKTPELLHAAGASEKVTADVMAFQPGGVDRGLRALVDQAAFVRNTENSGEKLFKSPFFRRRSCAF